MGCNKITKREDSSWFQEGFYNKYKAEETRKRYKVLLVAKGFIQTYRIKYTETFAPVAKLNTF